MGTNPLATGRIELRAYSQPHKAGPCHAGLSAFPLRRRELSAAGRSLGPSPGLRLRLDRLRWWATTGLDHLRAAISSFPIPHSPFPIPSASLLCDLFVAARPIVEPCLTQSLEFRVAWQPCIRDIWHENVLFSGDEVSGLIDFGALE